MGMHLCVIILYPPQPLYGFSYVVKSEFVGFCSQSRVRCWRRGISIVIRYAGVASNFCHIIIYFNYCLFGCKPSLQIYL
ncbi:hypothetical protein HOY80DRAFT_963169 [Tuber brumale]|nr:hypothetical protein HOY80DRAFT_963169 [Tuber brumale]